MTSEPELVEQAANPSVMDAQLVERVIARDESALAMVIDRYGAQVLGLCMKICPDALAANGVTSEVFWQFWRRADAFRAARGTLRSFLLTIARSRAIDQRRSINSLKRNIRQYSESTPVQLRIISDHQPDEAMTNRERKRCIQDALDRLPEEQRKALEMAFFSGLTHREVAIQLQLPLGTVKSHIRKGILKLRMSLKELSDGIDVA